MRKTLPPTREHCGFYSKCVEDGKLNCPTTYNQIDTYRLRNPMPLSEQVCIQALKNNTLRRAEDPYVGICQEVDYNLEMSLALARHDKKAAEKYLLLATEKLHETDNISYKELHTGNRRVFHAHMRAIDAFMPAYRDRLDGKPVSHQSASEVHVNICNHLRDFDSNYINTYPQPSRRDKILVESIRAEHEVMALGSRIDPQYLMFPAFNREESSQHRRLNHDLYSMDADLKKSPPIQVKLSKDARGYDKRVLVINHHDIMRALREAQQDTEDEPPYGTEYTTPVPAPKLPTITELLLREKRSGGYDKEALYLLNLASSYVTTRINLYS